MHKSTVDWYSPTHLTRDAELCERRWDAAAKVVKKLDAVECVALLRLFLFEVPSGDFATKFTDLLVAEDKGFPIRDNLFELRITAGVAIATTFENPSRLGEALALGLQSAAYPPRNLKSAQPDILVEAQHYLQTEATRVRPDFNGSFGDVAKTITNRGKALAEAEDGEDEAQIKPARIALWKAIADATTSVHRSLSRRVDQLAEETSLLWWVFGEYSETLSLPVRGIEAVNFAIVAAVEAARHVAMLPPPPSMDAILYRALLPTKGNSKKIRLTAYLDAVSIPYRTEILKNHSPVISRDLTPILFLLDKTVETGSSSTALQILSQQSSGIDIAVTPIELTRQLFHEIIFLRALNQAHV